MIFTSTRFSSAPVELAVENFLPPAEVEHAFSEGGDDLAPITCRFRCVLVVPAALFVVDEHRCADVDGVEEGEALLDAAPPQARLDVGRDVDERGGWRVRTTAPCDRSSASLPWLEQRDQA
jgi:hypothetical protein